MLLHPAPDRRVRPLHAVYPAVIALIQYRGDLTSGQRGVNVAGQIFRQVACEWQAHLDVPDRLVVCLVADGPRRPGWARKSGLQNGPQHLLVVLKKGAGLFWWAQAPVTQIRLKPGGVDLHLILLRRLLQQLFQILKGLGRLAQPGVQDVTMRLELAVQG